LQIIGGLFFIFVIGSIVIGVLYWVVWSVIQNSDLAQDVREIKEMLKKQLAESEQEVASERNGQSEQRGYSEREGYSEQKGFSDQIAFSGLQLHDDCPGCGTRVLLTDHVCKSCGLTLFDQDE
jgi:Na+-translocating ferredoxin:NAD+ oxidoreductase RnfG subunit